MIKKTKEQKLRLITSKPSDIPFHLPIKHRKRSTSERTTSDSNKTIPVYHTTSKASIASAKAKLLYALVQQSLFMKHSITPQSYLRLELENVIQSKYCRTLAVFKEKLLFHYQDEFLKRYYKTKESKDRIPKFVAYYKNYLIFFCNAVFSELGLNDLIQAYSECKAKIYYTMNCKEHSGESKERDKEGYWYKKDSNTIFNTTVKENISLNSFSSFVLNRCDSNDFNKKTLIQNPSNFINRSSAEAVNELMSVLSPQKKIKEVVTISYPIKKYFLKKSLKKQVLSINKTSFKGKRTKKKTIITTDSLNRAYSPQANALINRHDNYICYTESNQKERPNPPINSFTSRNKGNHSYMKTQTESFSTYHRNTTLINKIKLFTNSTIKQAFNHNKNVFSTQITEAITERLRQSVKTTSKKKDGKVNVIAGGGLIKPLKLTITDKVNKKNSALNSLARTSRNVKCELEKCFLTIENDSQSFKAVKHKKDEAVKFPMFKTLTIKGGNKHNKVISLTKKR